MTAREFLDAHAEEITHELADWVRIRSVSSEPEQAMDILRSANWLAGRMRAVGFPTVEVWQEPAAPAVYAEWCAAPGAPTVLVYSHHDVRSVREATWGETVPFDPQVRDGRMYGRGASDAKGQVLAHLWGIAAHVAAAGRDAPAVNVRILVEGEEETGSPGLRTLLEQRRDRLDADLVVLSDTMLWRADVPAVCLGIRGMVSAHLEIRGPERDVHSGAVSGAAPNPCTELCRLLGQLHDEKGRVTLPGFYDAVAELDRQERAEIAALPYSDEDWLARTESRSVGGEAGYSVLERVWARPAIEVLTLVGGDPIGPSRGAIPSVASADLSIRTVPDQRAQDVAEQLERWVAERISDRVEYDLSVPLEHAQERYRTPTPLPAVDALRRAMGGAFGGDALSMRNGGGAPADLLSTVLDAPVVFFGTGLPEDNWHDSDEHVDLATLRRGADTLARFWTELAAT